MWEFAVPLFLLDSSYTATSASSSSSTVTSGSSAGSASLLLVALYGLSESLAMSLFSVPIGTWVDLCPRLPLAAFAISAQNAALFLAAIAVAALLYLADFLAAPAAASSAGPDLFAWVTGAAETGADVALVAAVCVLGAAAALAGLARGIAVERDWAVVIADWVCEQEGAANLKRGCGRQGGWEDRGQDERERGGGVVEVVVGNEEDATKTQVPFDNGEACSESARREREEGGRDGGGEHHLRTHVVEESGVSEAGGGGDADANCRDKAAQTQEVLTVQQQGQQEGREGQQGQQRQEQEQQGREQRERVRARLNSTLRTIDLLCRLLAPAVTGALMAAAVSASTSASASAASPSATPPSAVTSPASPARHELLPVSLPLAMAVWVLVAAAAELLLLALVHSQVPALGERRKERAGEGMVEDERAGERERESEGGEEEEVEEEEDEEAEEEEEEEQGRGRGVGRGGDDKNGALDVKSSASGAAAVTGVLGATLFPSLCARLGPSRTAEASVWSQLACLLPCVVAGLVLQSSGPIPAVLLMAGVVLSRAPLWVFDLSVLQMVQGAVVEEERGAVGGVQESLQQGMQLVALVLAAVISRPRDFWVLTTVSGGAVMLAAVLVSVDRRLRGILRRIRRGGWQRQAEGLMGVDGRAGSGAGADEV
ncbi:unnamed protein product [Closterium sp. NIES-65]|nr:unnamed protein product [Closterium sp. NIES-65]